MAAIQQTHAPILNSRAQVLIIPVNTAGILLDPVLARTKTLYPDNYQRYYRACRDGNLVVGSCLLHKRVREHAGLIPSHNSNQPSYIANLIVSDHPYHPPRQRWLNAALTDFCQQLIPLIRHQGVRQMALLARPLIFIQASDAPSSPDSSHSANTITVPLDWHSATLPLLVKHLQDLPRVRTDLHIPKSMALDSD